MAPRRDDYSDDDEQYDGRRSNGRQGMYNIQCNNIIIYVHIVYTIQ